MIQSEARPVLRFAYKANVVRLLEHTLSIAADSAPSCSIAPCFLRLSPRFPFPAAIKQIKFYRFGLVSPSPSTAAATGVAASATFTTAIATAMAEVIQ